jgi:endonuclease/exonuclease/phosphatase family metal-dependent hydrolase
MIYADLRLPQGTVRVITTHLQSVRFNRSDYEGLSDIKRMEDSTLGASRTIISKLKRGYRFRTDQAALVRQQVDRSPHPVILTGDFNDVPNSFTYFTIRAGLQDAFTKEGSGLGRTFRYISPNLRIDYILTDSRYKVLQYHRFRVPYSDHYPVVADLRWK